MDWNFIDAMKSTLDNWKGVEPTTIKFGDGKNDEWNNLPVVYVIRLDGGDPDATFEKYKKYFETNYERGKCHLPPLNGKSSPVLYVGKKRTGVALRLNEHWNADPSTNSALRIAKWGADLPLEIDLYVFPKEAASLLSALEFGIAAQLLPAIGQHGKI